MAQRQVLDAAVHVRAQALDLITNVMIYWVTRTATSSAPLYWEFRKSGRRRSSASPRSWVERHYNVTRWTNMPRGGHFGAMEEPELFVEDVRSFFRGVR
jgi:pimeloyl-ACP methyl ester carboxylesterase